MSKGTVESYSEQKGFGFIIQEDGKKVSFYRSSIQMDGYKKVNAGDRVSFDVERLSLALRLKTSGNSNQARQA